MGAALFSGYRLGFLARISSWIGLLVGVVVAVRVLPLVLGVMAENSSFVLLLVTLGVVLLLGWIGKELGLRWGTRLHTALPGRAVRQADRLAGAGVAVAGVVLAIWVLLPVMADVPGRVSAQVRTSAAARTVDEHLPDPPGAIETLQRMVDADEFPRVFEAFGPAPQIGPPPSSANIAPATVRSVIRSTVKVSAVACGRVREGSGFVVGNELVVTNAHVVAGGNKMILQRSDGSEVTGQVVAFDPKRDLAAIRVPGLDRPPLAQGDTTSGGLGAVFGHPGGGALRAAPFSVAQVVTATGRDIYDRQDTRRDIFVLAVTLRPGDSGAAMVDGQGAVVGVAFAVAPDRAGVAYGLAMSEVRAALAGGLQAPVSTGPCLE